MCYCSVHPRASRPEVQHLIDERRVHWGFPRVGGTRAARRRIQFRRMLEGPSPLPFWVQP
eukprot:9833406-Heterocapsa_arctica.AAC.1